jgi:ABC-type Mn2+/Zn2+ transport system ATPase subunit
MKCQEIMALFLNLVNSSISIKEKQLIIIAGANGSAKKTFAKQMSPKDPSKTRIAAGKKVIKLV